MIREMRVSHETIYRSLFVQARRGAAQRADRVSAYGAHAATFAQAGGAFRHRPAPPHGPHPRPPRSPWQRGTNENSNGLLRQYFPKNADLSLYTRAELNAVARQLNNRPRQMLGWMKPSEVSSRFVASTS